MIGKDESDYTYEFKDFFVIIPAIFNKTRFKKLLKNSKKVKSSFKYSSESNDRWLTEKNFKKWLSNYMRNKDLLN